MPIGRSPYSRDAKPIRPLPAPEETERGGFVRGTGPRARSLWAMATGVSVVGMGALVGVAGYSSESAGVATAYVAALVIGFCGGGWFGVVQAQRAGPTVGRSLPYVSAIVGALALVILAVGFFEGIFPAL